MAAGSLSGLFLLEVDVEIKVVFPSEVKDEYDYILNIIKTGLKSGSGRSLYSFRIVGESKLVVVADGGVNSAIDELNRTHTRKSTEFSFRARCTPLIKYATFLKNTIKLDPDLLKVFELDLNRQQHGIYVWVKAKVDYKGTSMEELLKMWSEEAEFVLKGEKAGNGDFLLYKNVGEKVVHNFSRVDSLEEIDQMLFDQLPFYKNHGNQISITVKRIQVY